MLKWYEMATCLNSSVDTMNEKLRGNFIVSNAYQKNTSEVVRRHSVKMAQTRKEIRLVGLQIANSMRALFSRTRLYLGNRSYQHSRPLLSRQITLNLCFKQKHLTGKVKNSAEDSQLQFVSSWPWDTDQTERTWHCTESTLINSSQPFMFTERLRTPR